MPKCYFDMLAYDFSSLLYTNFGLPLLVFGSYLPACKFIKQKLQSSLTKGCVYHQHFTHTVKDTFTQTFNKYQKYKSDPALLFPTFKKFYAQILGNTS